MERQKIKNKQLIMIGLGIFYLVGIYIHLNPVFSDLIKFLTPLFLMISSVLVILEEKPSRRFLVWLILSYTITTTIEVIGVKTGLIFGSYNYGENLGLKILDVPLVIGLNWVVLVLASIGIVEKLKSTTIVRSFVVGLILVFFDLLLEIAAPILNYWFFEGWLVPVQNYLAWFLISFVLSYFYFHSQILRQNVIAKFNFLFQFVFFLLIVSLK